MSHELNPTQAFWLGHLYYADVLLAPLNAHAKARAVKLASLIAWEKRLITQVFLSP